MNAPPVQNLETMGGHMIRGSAWMIAMRWGLRGIGLVSTVIYARLLEPADFGIVAMAMVVFGFLQVLSYTNVDLALIQNPDATDDHYNAAWTIQILEAAIIALLVFAAAPFAAEFFAEPRVAPVLRTLALVALFAGFENIGIVNFRKELNFYSEFKYNLYVKSISFIFSVAIVVYLRNYIALVISLAVYEFLKIVVSYAMHPFRPRLSFRRVREVWSFSRWMLVFQVGVFLRNKFDAFVVGRLLGTELMGSYHMASEISTMPTNELIMPVGRALFPSYAKLAHDADEMGRAFCRVLAVLTILCVPLGLGLAAVAEDAVAVLLGGKWGAAVPLMQWLAVAGIVSGLAHAAGVFVVATGRPKVNAVLTWLNLLLLVPALVVGGTVWGIHGVAAGRTVVAVLFLPLLLHFVTRAARIGWAQIAGATWRPVVAGAVMVLAVVALHADAVRIPAVTLGLDVLTGGAAYVAVCALLWRLSGRPDGPERMVVDALARRWPGLRHAAGWSAPR